MFAHERRLHPRFPFPSIGKFRLNTLAYCGNRFDISLFGALSEAKLLHLDFVPKERCSLEMLQLNDDSLFTIDCSIAHHRMSLIGIRFVTIDTERRNALRRTSTFNLVPSSLLNRDIPTLFQAWQA